MEILAVFGTLFGVATSLGLGVQQINAGLDYLGFFGASQTNQLILIAVITGLATVSVVSGLDVGIRRLSELNLGLGVLLVLFVFIVGPTVFLLSTFVESLGRYLTSLVQVTFRTDAFTGTEWQASWTMFYWGWWISWSPFVGMFIARISRGRTIRSFVAGVLIVPTLLTFAWMIVFGNTALHMELFGEGGISAAVAASVPTSLFVMLGQLPWTVITTTLATLVVATFFVTSSDSASLVVDILTSNGDPNPPVWSRIFWALMEGAVAAVLLVTGGLIALRTAAIATALPFCLVMLVMCYSLVRGLRAEQRAGFSAFPLGTTELGDEAEGGAEDSTVNETGWRDRLGHIVGRAPVRGPDEKDFATLRDSREKGAAFIDQAVVPAFREIRRELQKHGREVAIEKLRFQAGLIVTREGKEEFRYAVRVRVFRRAVATFPELERPDTPRVLRGEIILRGGVHRDYDLSDFSRQGIIEDFLHEYAKWMGW